VCKMHEKNLDLDSKVLKLVNENVCKLIYEQFKHVQVEESLECIIIIIIKL
jgi:hypothetical protein